MFPPERCRLLKKDMRTRELSALVYFKATEMLKFKIF